jgi:hypothetical protein
MLHLRWRHFLPKYSCLLQRQKHHTAHPVQPTRSRSRPAAKRGCQPCNQMPFRGQVHVAIWGCHSFTAIGMYISAV